MFDRGVFVMALPAIILAWGGRTCSLFGGIETEVGPLVREALFIFDFRVEAHEVGLITAVLVDRALRSRTVELQDEDSLVRPVPMREIVAVGRRIDEHVCEHHHAVVGLLRIAHAIAGRGVYPAPVTLRPHQLAVRSELRAGSRGGCRLAATRRSRD